MMSDVKVEDVPQKVPNLAYWAEKAQEELDIGRNMNIKGLHTVICIDTSDSMKHGAAWEQTKQFFIQFIQGLKEVEEVDEEFVALSVFGQEVKVVQRLTNNYISLLEAFSLLKLGGPTPLYGGLLMALAGVTSLMTGVTRDVEIAPRVILVTDGHPTDPLLIAGSDVCNPEEMIKNQLIAVQAVEKISSKKVRLDCVPVGEANSTFFDLLATKKHAKVYSYKDGRKLARRAINSFHAGHILEQWRHARVLGTSLGKEISLEDVWDMLDVTEIPSLSPGEKEEVLEIAKATLKKDDVTEGQQHSEDIFEKYYEFDDPDIMLPPLGTRVRRGPDWIRGQEDSNGPGTITGHHKNRRQVHVEWDKNGISDFYCYGDKGKYDVIIVDEPRILMSGELIATGCIVRRGKDWRWENQDGAPGATGVVIKVRDDGWVMVRWANKTKNLYRYSAGWKFDLDICPVESQIAGVAAQLEPPYTPESVLNRVQNEARQQHNSFQKYHNESLKLPPLGTRVRRRVACDKDQQDGNVPGTIIGHNESQNQVFVEWDGSGRSGFYCFKDMDTSEVVVVDEPRVLQLIVTGCHVKQGKDWIYGNENGTPDAIGVVLNVREDGMALVRWPNKFKRYYRYDLEGYLELDIWMWTHKGSQCTRFK